LIHLDKYTGGYSLGEWISFRLEELYRHTIPHNVPIDLEPLLKSRKIHWPPEYSTTVQRGALKPISGGFKLIIGNHLRYASRRGELRFTIAHELGHTFFYSLGSDTPQRRQNIPLHSKEEEIICERFAAELLMPTDYVIKWYEKRIRKSFVESIVDFAEKFEVSTAAAARRMVEDLELWHGVVIGCQVQNAGTMTDSPELDARIIWAVNSHRLGTRLYIPQASTKRRGLAKVIIPGMTALSCSAANGKSVNLSVTPDRIRIPGDFLKHVQGFLSHTGNIFVEFIKIGTIADKSQLAYFDKVGAKSTYERFIIAIPSVGKFV